MRILVILIRIWESRSLNAYMYICARNCIWCQFLVVRRASCRCVPVTGSVSVSVSLSVFVSVSSNLVSCISTRFLLGQTRQSSRFTGSGGVSWNLVNLIRLWESGNLNVYRYMCAQL